MALGVFASWWRKILDPKWFSDFTNISSPVFWERIEVRAIKQTVRSMLLIRKPLFDDPIH
jgi:hypothetical protein